MCVCGGGVYVLKIIKNSLQMLLIMSHPGCWQPGQIHKHRAIKMRASTQQYLQRYPIHSVLLSKYLSFSIILFGILPVRNIQYHGMK